MQVRREILIKLWSEILLKFLWRIEKLCPEIGFRLGFVSISALNNIKNGIDQAAKSYHIIKYKKDTKTLRTRKEWNL